MSYVLKQSPDDLVEVFVEENRKLRVFIYWMKKIFKYIDGVEVKEEETLFQISHNLYVGEVKFYC